MRRRLFLAGSGLAVVPRLAAAQRPGPAVGYLAGQSAAVAAPLRAAFAAGLADTGFEDGRNVTIVFATSDGQAERLPALARDLVDRPVSVLFASSTASARAARAATRTLPIVYTGASDPVSLGLAESLARPGGNLTGATMYAHTFAAKRLEMLHELLPAARRVGILINPNNPSAEAVRGDIVAAARTLGLDTAFAEAWDRKTIDDALALLASRDVRAVYLSDDPLFTSAAADLMTLALSRRLAVLSTLESQAAAGALASFGTDFAEVHRQCGVYVGRILKGERPADLPILLPTRFRLVINRKTARQLDIAIPPTLLARADEVIE
jgi:putative ABC transport system substrate-binding protein